MDKIKEIKAHYRRPWKGKKSRPVTPCMLVRSLKILHESKLFGVYFSPAEVARVIARKYPVTEQDPKILLQEVNDKLMCAAAADIIGYKIDSGYHLLTPRARCMRIDTTSELAFWLLYKQIKEANSKTLKKENKFSDSYYKGCNCRIK